MNSDEFELVNNNYFESLPDNVAMKTAVWGPPTWFFLHSMALAYPKKIDENNSKHLEIKNSMYAFLSNLGNILPCSLCGTSYKSYIKSPELQIHKYLNSRADLFHFLYLIHERVNEKLGVPKCNRPSLSEVVKYYSKFRARGDTPCTATTEQERLDSLLAGCNDSDMKNKKFKNYKCIVNVIDKNTNKTENLSNNFKNTKENFNNLGKKENFNKNCTFLTTSCILLFITVFILIFLLIRKRK